MFAHTTRKLREAYFDVASDAAWNALGKIAERASLAIALILVARILGPFQFGTFGIVQNTIVTLQVIAAFGMSVTATRYVAAYHAISPQKTTEVALLCLAFSGISGLVLSILSFVLSGHIADFVAGTTELSKYLQIGSGLIFLYPLEGALSGILMGLRHYRTIALASLFVGALLIVGLPLAALRGKISGALAALNCIIGTKILLLLYATIRNFTQHRYFPRISQLLQHFPILWKFSLPAFLAGLTFSPALWGASIMLARQPNGMKQVGYFSACYQWFSLILFLPSVVGQIFLPLFSQSAATLNHAALRKDLLRGSKLIAGILGIVALAVCIFSPVIMRFYGQGYQDSWKILSILAVSGFFAGSQNYLGNFLASMDKMWMHFSLNILWMIIFLGLSYFSTHKMFGAFGVAASHSISYGIRFLVLIFIITAILRNHEYEDTVHS